MSNESTKVPGIEQVHCMYSCMAGPIRAGSSLSTFLFSVGFFFSFLFFIIITVLIKTVCSHPEDALDADRA